MLQCSLSKSALRTHPRALIAACRHQAWPSVHVRIIGRRSMNIESTAARHKALTLQHKLERILKSTFEIGGGYGSPNSAEVIGFWQDILTDTFENLSAAPERPARVAVLGFGEWSGAEDLVTALLEEPLSSDTKQKDILRNRWKVNSSMSSLTISTDSRSPSSDRLLVSSSYLSQFSVPLEITELRTTTTPRIYLSSLYKADLPIVVFNPLVTPLSALKCSSFPSHTIFVASYSPSLNDSKFHCTLQSQLPSSTHSSSLLSNVNANATIETTDQARPTLLFVDPERALNALETFSTDPTSAFAVQHYQHNFSQSGIGRLTQHIKSIVDAGSGSSGRGTSIAHLRNRAALLQLQEVLSAMESYALTLQHRVNDAREGIQQLLRKVEDIKAKIPVEVLGSKDSEVETALWRAGEEMKEVMGKLNWWKTMWRADEVGLIVGSALDRVWCSDMKEKLVFRTGYLFSLQSDLINAASNLIHLQARSSSPPLPSPSSGFYLSTPDPSSPAHSPLIPAASPPTMPKPARFCATVLENDLQRLAFSGSSEIGPTSLTFPLDKRKSQLKHFPTTRLHLTAQRTVLSMSVGMTGSLGVSWAAWMAWLTQVTTPSGSGIGQGLWTLIGFGMDPTTGMGLGLLGAALSMRWAVGRWEREKKRWWRDWERIGQGLGRDLKSTAETVVSEKVVVVAETACKGLEELCQQHQKEVEVAKEEVLKLQTELRDIASKTDI